jgi:hypothetical protein
MMFRLTQTSISCSNLSAVATYEHVDSSSSSTHLQLIGKGGALGELSKYSPDTPRLPVLEDAVVEAASPRAVSHPEILIPECEPFFSQET